ncbi:MAG: dienelactone hydrolase family protein [Vicinamibacterales bacterium]
MQQKTAEDFDPDLLVLFDAYVHGDIDRRGFLDRAAKFAVGTVTAGMLLDALTPKFAEAQQVPKDDKGLKAEYVEYESPQGSGKMRGYLARPANATGKLPGIIVIHENRGLNPHIEDIARRLALDNFMAFAPDALFPLGGYPGDEDKARELFPKLDGAKTREDFVTATNWLMKRADCTGKVGAVGFCWGGSMTHTLATRVPELAAAVPFYGSAPAAENAAKVKSPMLLQFAETDERVNASWPPYEEALKTNNVKYEAFKYPGTQHGFNNDTTPRYNAEAAMLAWTRTVAFFNMQLR